MNKILKFGQTIRNNWKKSVVGAFAVYYGAQFAKEKYEINLLMRAACKEAVKYGDYMISMDQNPMMVTVILNPVANKRKAKQDFEKYCAPLLHLAGLQVEVIQTASEGNAKEIVETLKGTEAIIVAGGDGTLSETVTGLLRRNDDANRFPLGILPLGRTNTIGNTLFPDGKGAKRVKQMIEACFSIIEGNTTWKDAMKVELIVEENETQPKPVYGLCSLEWGAFRDVLAKKDKYWIYGALREYAAFVFNGYKDSLNWNCSGEIKYTPPCSGCSNCLLRRPIVKRKWSFFMHSKPEDEDSNPITRVNPECASTQELCFKTCDFRIKTPNVQETNGPPALTISIGKNKYSYAEFVSAGWDRINDSSISNGILARTIELRPRDVTEGTVLEIDKEEYEAKPVKITLLPKVVKLFCKKSPQ